VWPQRKESSAAVHGLEQRESWQQELSSVAGASGYAAAGPSVRGSGEGRQTRGEVASCCDGAVRRGQQWFEVAIVAGGADPTRAGGGESRAGGVWSRAGCRGGRI